MTCDDIYAVLMTYGYDTICAFDKAFVKEWIGYLQEFI